MTYKSLVDEAKAIVESERETYALEKLTNKMKKINQQEMILNHAIKELDRLKTDLEDLCTQEVGYPAVHWQKGADRSVWALTN